MNIRCLAEMAEFLGNFFKWIVATCMPQNDTYCMMLLSNSQQPFVKTQKSRLQNTKLIYKHCCLSKTTTVTLLKYS